MDIGRFITDYVKTASTKVKEDMIKKHVVATYIPYETKVAEAKKIVETTSFTKVDNRRTFWMDTTTRYILFMKEVIVLYTDLEWDQINFLIQFNLLEQYGILDQIIANIGSDYEKFQTVLNMTLDDMMTNERSFLSYVENMGQAIGVVADQIVEALPNILTEALGETESN